MTHTETALFGLGCFWNSEEVFSRLSGVTHVVVGYAGGTNSHPTYFDRGDHTEVVKVEFDPHRMGYEELLDVFWQAHDPTIAEEPHYRSLILYTDDTQKRIAQTAKKQLQAVRDAPIVTAIEPLTTFYKAEAYHQHYLAKLRGNLQG